MCSSTARRAAEWFQGLNTGSGGFAYTSGLFSPGWKVVAGSLDGDAFDDLFVYNPAAGLWFQCFTDGAGGFRRFAPGSWSPGWSCIRCSSTATA